MMGRSRGRGEGEGMMSVHEYRCGSPNERSEANPWKVSVSLLLCFARYRIAHRKTPLKARARCMWCITSTFSICWHKYLQHCFLLTLSGHRTLTHEASIERGAQSFMSRSFHPMAEVFRACLPDIVPEVLSEDTPFIVKCITLFS